MTDTALYKNMMQKGSRSHDGLSKNRLSTLPMDQPFSDSVRISSNVANIMVDTTDDHNESYLRDKEPALSMGAINAESHQKVTDGIVNDIMKGFLEVRQRN